jgi:hypothetical protein
MSAAPIEERVSALEAEVARLRRIVEGEKPKSGWRQMVGAFLNDPYFEKAMKYGRQYRESQRPKKKKRSRGHGHT